MQKERVSKPKHPTTGKMIDKAILDLNDRNGSSLQMIKRYISNNFEVNLDRIKARMTKYIKDSLQDGTLVQMSGIGASGKLKLSKERKEDMRKEEKAILKKQKILEQPKELKENVSNGAIQTKEIIRRKKIPQKAKIVEDEKKSTKQKKLADNDQKPSEKKATEKKLTANGKKPSMKKIVTAEEEEIVTEMETVTPKGKIALRKRAVTLSVRKSMHKKEVKMPKKSAKPKEKSLKIKPLKL